MIWFLKNITPDGWMGLIGSFIGVITAYFIALYFYKKEQVNKKFDEEKTFIKLLWPIEKSIDEGVFKLDDLMKGIKNKDISVSKDTNEISDKLQYPKRALEDISKIPRELVSDNNYYTIFLFEYYLRVIIEDFEMYAVFNRTLSVEDMLRKFNEQLPITEKRYLELVNNYLSIKGMLKSSTDTPEEVK